jgi:hypothetical protein
MNDNFTNALTTSSFTVFLGFITFLLGQLALKLMDAAIELRSLIAEIDADLTLYVVDRTIAPGEERYRIFRRHGGRLHAAAWKVIGYSCFEDLFRLPPRKDVLKAARKVLDLASQASAADEVVSSIQKALDTKEEIRTLLRLRSPYSEQ